MTYVTLTIHYGISSVSIKKGKIMSKKEFNQNKILKLQNVLIGKINLEEEDVDLNIIVEKMQS